jgi:hypothetical protein
LSSKVPRRVAQLRATLANHTRNGRPVTDLRRELRAEVLAEKIKAAVAEWPEFTDSQRSRLAALLAPGGAE